MAAVISTMMMNHGMTKQRMKSANSLRFPERSAPKNQIEEAIMKIMNKRRNKMIPGREGANIQENAIPKTDEIKGGNR